MTKIKFIQFYNTLDKAGIKDFRKFACSDYFNGGRDLKGVLAAVEKLKNKNLGSKEFIKSLSAAFGITSRTTWNRLSELMKTAETYTALMQLKTNRLGFHKLTGSYFLNNNSYNLFEQNYRSAIKIYEKNKKSADSIQTFYELLQTGGYYYIFTNQGEKYAENLREQVIFHSASYMINHYLHLTEILQRSNITAKALAQQGLSFITDDSVEIFLKTLSDKHTYLFHILSVHYQIYKAFLTKNEDRYYENAMTNFDKAYGVIDDNYKALFYQILINYCINRTNSGTRRYYNNLFKLYNRKLEDGLYQDLTVGNFPINNFRDYIFVALQLGKIEWVKWFIEKYSRELPEKVRNDEINLSLGIVNYREGKYNEALGFLNLVAGDNYIHSMDSRYYKLRLFYDTERYEEAILEIDNYKHYLRAHKNIPESFRRMGKSQVSDYSKLMNIKLKDNYEDAELFKRELLAKEQNQPRAWVIKKLDEILGK